ncbi:MAG TPA: toast rack family protein [Chloroflexia bacterium]|nr:toast rack family protein [Chloroflexia bacterium]
MDNNNSTGKPELLNQPGNDPLEPTDPYQPSSANEGASDSPDSLASKPFAYPPVNPGITWNYQPLIKPDKIKTPRLWMVPVLLGGAVLFLVAAFTILFVIVVPALDNIGMTTEHSGLALGKASQVSVNVVMNSGDLKLNGGSAKLLDATFRYNNDSLRPTTSYSENAAIGTLLVKQPAVSDKGNYRNKWELQLHNGLPVDIRIDKGAGNNELKLAGMDLSELYLTSGAGDTTLDLTGTTQRTFSGTVTTGAGNVKVIVPRSTGARITIGGGFQQVSASNFTRLGNSYTNAAYGKSAGTLNLTIISGTGNVTLEER